jgi:hypothetical protein
VATFTTELAIQQIELPAIRTNSPSGIAAWRRGKCSVGRNGLRQSWSALTAPIVSINQKKAA